MRKKVTEPLHNLTGVKIILSVRAKRQHFMMRSYVVGDMGINDMALVDRIGAKGILILTGGGKGSLSEYCHTWSGIEAGPIAENLLEAAKWIVYHDLGRQ